LTAGEALKLRVQLSKEGVLRYLSHTEYWRTVMMAAKRSGLPLVYTGKYRSRMKISYSPPLPIGFTSECELIDFFISHYISPAEAQRTLQLNLPEGITVLRSKVIGSGSAPVGRLIDTALYIATMKCGHALAKDLVSAVNDFLNSTEVYVRRVQPRSVRDINIRGGVHRLEVAEAKSVKECLLTMVVDDGTRGTIKPREVVDYLLGVVKADPDVIETVRIHRKALFQMRGGRLISPMEVRARSRWGG